MIRSLPTTLLAQLIVTPCTLGATTAESITSNDYALELHIGPVVGSSRTISLAGAYTGVAEGAEGLSFNPAALAARWPYSVSWFDYDISIDFYLSGFLENNDFELTGHDSLSGERVLLVGALALQYGSLGFGISYMGYYACIDEPRGEDACSLGTLTSRKGVRGLLSSMHLLQVGAAYGFFSGELLVGVMSVTPIYELRAIDSGESLAALDATETGGALGVLWRPRKWPFRVGLAARLPNTARSGDPNEAQGDTVMQARGYITPSAVTVPWQVSLGASLSWGPRVFNAGWKNPHAAVDDVARGFRDERRRRRRQHAASLQRLPREERTLQSAQFEAAEEKRRAKEKEVLAKLVAAAEQRALEAHKRAERRFVMLSLDLALTGPTSTPATGLNGFVTQTLHRAGRRPTLKPSVGIELEPWTNWLRARSGSYLELSRYDGVLSRVHFTFGFDFHVVHMPPWFDLRLSALLDAASQYLNVGLSLGVWH